MTIKEAANEFLAKKRIAVTGVSRKPQTHAANAVYRRLRQLGYEVFAVNPNVDQVEGDRCFHDLKSIPGGVEAVVMGTRPEHALPAIRECAELGIREVWMHRSFGAGSVSAPATAWGRDHGIRVIDGGCPLMFKPAADVGHVLTRSLFRLTGKIPRCVF
jgi:predicted CoA-binding protein